MARDKQPRRMFKEYDRDPDQPEVEQPKRRYEHVRDYLGLRRFRMDFGREFNATNFWGDQQRRDGGGR